jgi:hypothetical protein
MNGENSKRNAESGISAKNYYKAAPNHFLHWTGVPIGSTPAEEFQELREHLT